jgi:hypothetical protein
LHLF